MSDVLYCATSEQNKLFSIVLINCMIVSDEMVELAGDEYMPD